MYARHYSHSIRRAGTAASAPPDPSAVTTGPPVLRLVQPLEEAAAAPSPGAAPASAVAPVTVFPDRRRERLLDSEAGMATAEYAIATLAAVGFAGLLVFILRSEEVRGFLLTLIRTALALP